MIKPTGAGAPKAPSDEGAVISQFFCEMTEGEKMFRFYLFSNIMHFFTSSLPQSKLVFNQF